MKALTTTLVDVNQEAAAVAQYVTERWDGIADPLAVIQVVQQYIQKRVPGWLAEHLPWQFLHDALTAREALLKQHLPAEQAEEARYYDAIILLYDQFSGDIKRLKDYGVYALKPWNFGSEAGKVHSLLLEQIPGFADVYPKGWTAASEAYARNEYSNEKANLDLFEGHDTTSVRGLPFPARIAMGQVLYEAKQERRPPSRVLAGALLAHFLGIHGHNNDCALIESVKALPVEVSSPDMVFALPKLQSNNPLVAMLLYLHYQNPAASRTAEEQRNRMLDSIAAAKAYEALSDEEKAQRKRDVDADMEVFFEELRNGLSAEKQAEQDALEAADKAMYLRLVYGITQASS